VVRRSGPPFGFVVVFEDDLALATDAVEYFQQLSRVMRVDSSIYCVAAHQDHAYLATSSESPSQLHEFAFRRGNHFMAPGEMTSREIYSTLIQPRWLDAAGEYKEKDRLHLRNGPLGLLLRLADPARGGW
jgi:hypothetical protein